MEGTKMYPTNSPRPQDISGEKMTKLSKMGKPNILQNININLTTLELLRR